MTGRQLARGMEAVTESGIFTVSSVKSSVDVPGESGKTPKNRGSKGSVPSSVKSSVRGSEQGIPNSYEELLNLPQVLKNQYSTATKKPACNSLQTGNIGATGLEPATF